MGKALTVKATDAVNLAQFSIDHNTQKKRCNRCGLIMSTSVGHVACPPADEVKLANGNYVWPSAGTDGVEDLK